MATALALTARVAIRPRIATRALTGRHRPCGRMRAGLLAGRLAGRPRSQGGWVFRSEAHRTINTGSTSRTTSTALLGWS